jgi:hypothetical protein
MKANYGYRISRQSERYSALCEVDSQHVDAITCSPTMAPAGGKYLQLERKIKIMGRRHLEPKQIIHMLHVFSDGGQGRHELRFADAPESALVGNSAIVEH